MRENRPSGLMRGGSQCFADDNYGLHATLRWLPPTPHQRSSNWNGVEDESVQHGIGLRLQAVIHSIANRGTGQLSPPVTRQSGNTKSVYMRNRCPKFSRQTFHENAGCALRADPWAAEFHAHYKSQHGGHHHQANRSLAFKLIRIYYACWRDRKPYDPARYLEALEKKGSPIAKRLQSAEKSHPKKS